MKIKGRNIKCIECKGEEFDVVPHYNNVDEYVCKRCGNKFEINDYGDPLWL